jgi:aspartate racemase
MHIGLIGGIGIAATLVYYPRLVRAIEALGGRPEITIVHGQVQELVANNLADDREAQAAIYATLVDRLRDAGADCAALTSLGGHFCFEETLARSSLPLVSAVAPLDAFFQREGLRTVGLLGTRVVMRTSLYGQLARTRAVALDDEVDALGQRYTDMAMAGVCSPEDRAAFLGAGERLMRAGADAVVLAGTDLGLAFDGRDTGYRVIDALDVHVDVLADLGAGRAKLTEVAAAPTMS